VSDVHVSGLKKQPVPVRDGGLPGIASSLANASVSDRLDSSRAVSTSHLDAVQLRQPVITGVQHQRSESAVSRLAPRVTAEYTQPGATEAKQGSDQRVMEWQMRNQMARGADSPGQVPRGFDNEPNLGLTDSKQKPSYYPAKPQSHLVEPGYVMPASAKTVSSQPLSSASMLVSTDSAAGNRGQMFASSGLQSSVSAGAVSSSVSTLVYADDLRYRPSQQQLQHSMYDQQPGVSAAPQFAQAANVRPQMSQMVRQPLPGMAVQDVYQPGGPNRNSNLPTSVYQQPPAFGKSTQHRPLSDVTGPTIAVSSVQKPSNYSARPQSQLMEPGYAMPAPAKTTALLPQSNASVPVTTENLVGNRSQISTSSGQQFPSGPVLPNSAYSDDLRYRPPQQQLPPSMYDQRSTMSAVPQLNPVANMRPEMPQNVRQPLLGMASQDIRYPGPSVRSNLPSVAQLPVVTASGAQYQYRPPAGQYGVPGATNSVGMTPPGMQYVGGRMPAVSTSADGMAMLSDYISPNIYDRRSLPQLGVQYEMANVESRAVPAGVPLTADNRPHSVYEGPTYTEGPRPADIRYGVQNVVGAMPPTRPVVPDPQTGIHYRMPNVGGQMAPAPPSVRYDATVSDSRLPEAMPAGSQETSRDQALMKPIQQGGYYESPNTAVSYGSQEAPYRSYSTSGSTAVVPANARYEASRQSSTGDSWPLPPQSDSYGAPNVQNVPHSVSVPPQPSGYVPVPQFYSTGNDSRPLPFEVRPRMQNAASAVPSLPPGMPASDVRPKKLPPPIAAKPKISASTGRAMKPSGEITKDEGKQLKPEKMQQKMLEIQHLESRPYLTANEQTKLRNLRIEVEFDKRLADLNEKRSEDGGDVEQSRMFPPLVRLDFF